MRCNKHIILTLFALHISCLAFKDRYSQSFLYSRPAYFNIVADQTIWHKVAFDDERTLAFQVIPFYQHTFMQSHNITRYFLMECKDQLAVKGDTAAGGSPQSRNRDIRAEWLGITSDTFDGSFTICPKQSQSGFSISGKVALSEFANMSFLKCFWLGLSTEYQVVENKLNFSESTSPNSDQTIWSAMTNSSWCYGKYIQEQTKSGFGDIRFTVGSRLINCRGWEFGVTSYLGIPGHGHVNQYYVFSPQIGFNGHYAWGTQIMIQMPLEGACEDRSFNIFIDGDVAYLFKNKQYRSLDLCNKPWTRYLLLNNVDGQSNIPGINILTQRVKASPYCLVNVAAGIRAIYRNFEGVASYTIYAHGDEKLRLKNEWRESYGIAGSDATHTANASTIQYRAENDATFIPIRKQDIDLKSGAARATMSNIVQCALSAFGTTRYVSGFLSIGGYMEYAYKNCTLSNWGIWGKLGAGF
jgi:hypothetical protein